MSPPLIICDTSPLFYLHQAGCLDVLATLYESVIVPPAVVMELEAGRKGGWDSPVIGGLPWIQITAVTATSLLPAIVDLGAGEVEVIALGLEIKAASNSDVKLILDDQLARRIADLYKLSYTGTLGVIIKAKQRGLLRQSVQEIIHIMQERGMWLSQSVINSALKIADEM